MCIRDSIYITLHYTTLHYITLHYTTPGAQAEVHYSAQDTRPVSGLIFIYWLEYLTLQGIV